MACKNVVLALPLPSIKSMGWVGESIFLIVSFIISTEDNPGLWSRFHEYFERAK